MLLGVKFISRADTKRYRLILGGVLGGLSSLLVLLNLGVGLTVIKISIAFIMVLVSFPFLSIKAFLKKSAWLLIVSMLFAGVCFGIYFLFDTDLMIYSNGTVYFDIDITFLTVCTVISYFVITIISRFTDKKIPEKQFYDITLFSGSENIKLKGFLDTGNNLKEPFSYSPVIVTNEKIYKKLYSASTNKKERLIPVSTVKGEGVMSAFKLDKVVLQNRSIENIYLGKSSSLPENCEVLLCTDLFSEVNI